jgi:arginine:pyruvate transaminase
LSRRAASVAAALDGVGGLRVMRPEAGMFVLVDVAATGRDGAGVAEALLDETGVAVMPGNAFGKVIPTWVRIGLTVPDARLSDACRRIADFASRARRRRIA